MSSRNSTLVDTSDNGNDWDYKYFAAFDYLYEWQYQMVFVVGLCSSLLSIAGSCSIVYLIVRERRVHFKDTYQRFMLGLSCTDLVVTAGLLLTPFMLPGVTQLPYAVGDARTCEAAGFLLQFIIGSYLYNAELSIYFLLTVRYGMKQHEIAAKFWFFEPLAHTLPIVVPAITGVIGVTTDVFNPSPITFLCSPQPYPPTCRSPANDIECTRGSAPYDYIIVIMQSSVMGICALVGTGCTWSIYRTIRNQTRKNRNHSFDDSMTDAAKRRLRQVGIQAMWYTFAFLVGVTTIVTAIIVIRTYVVKLPGGLDSLRGNNAVFALVLVTWLLYPLQGFINQLIYVRPRYIQWRNECPDKSRLWAYIQVILGRVAPTTSSSISGKKKSSICSIPNSTTATRHSHGTSLCQSHKQHQQHGDEDPQQLSEPKEHHPQSVTEDYVTPSGWLLLAEDLDACTRTNHDGDNDDSDSDRNSGIGEKKRQALGVDCNRGEIEAQTLPSFDEEDRSSELQCVATVASASDGKDDVQNELTHTARGLDPDSPPPTPQHPIPNQEAQQAPQSASEESPKDEKCRGKRNSHVTFNLG